MEPKLRQKSNFNLFEEVTQNWILPSMDIPNQNPDSSNLVFRTIIKSKELVVQTSSTAATGTAQQATPKALPLQFSGPLYDPPLPCGVVPRVDAGGGGGASSGEHDCVDAADSFPALYFPRARSSPSAAISR